MKEGDVLAIVGERGQHGTQSTVSSTRSAAGDFDRGERGVVDAAQAHLGGVAQARRRRLVGEQAASPTRRAPPDRCPAAMVRTGLTSFGLPPAGPFSISTREASTMVSVGRISAASSAMARCTSWWSIMRCTAVMPNQFLSPQVTPVREWCLATGTLMILVANDERIEHVPGAEPLRDLHRAIAAVLGQDDLGAGRVAAARMPLRSNALRAFWTGQSHTMTRPGPRLAAQPNHLGHHLGVRVGALLGRAVPTRCWA